MSGRTCLSKHCLFENIVFLRQRRKGSSVRCWSFTPKSAGLVLVSLSVELERDGSATKLFIHNWCPAADSSTNAISFKYTPAAVLGMAINRQWSNNGHPLKQESGVPFVQEKQVWAAKCGCFAKILEVVICPVWACVQTFSNVCWTKMSVLHFYHLHTNPELSFGSRFISNSLGHFESIFRRVPLQFCSHLTEVRFEHLLEMLFCLTVKL